MVEILVIEMVVLVGVVVWLIDSLCRTNNVKERCSMDSHHIYTYRNITMYITI